MKVTNRSVSSALVALIALLSTASAQAVEAEKVAEIKGTQITGVTVSSKGDVFVNAPNWRDDVEFAVAKVTDNGEFKPYPNAATNACVAKSIVRDDCFLAVQSVVAHGDKLYVLDTRNPKFQGVIDAPRLFVVDLSSGNIDKVLTLSEQAYHPHSYINDLRVDDKTNRIYLTDSNAAGIVVYNLEDDTSYRILDDHDSTRAQLDKLNIAGTVFNATVHSDGIALDTLNDTLYFHALTGYRLYAINTDDIQPNTNAELAPKVRMVAETGAPDGLFYHRGNVYLADLERHLIQYLTPSLDLRTLVSGDDVSWADTFGLYNNSLYYTNSKIHLAGEDVSDLSFEVFKVPLPQE